MAVLSFWTPSHSRTPPLAELATAQPGVYWLSDRRCALAPLAGDPGVFDSAVALAGRLLSAARRPTLGSTGPSGDTARALIFPGWLTLGAEGPSLDAEPISDAFPARAPELLPGSLSITTYGLHRLELPQRVEPVTHLEPRSGERIPILRVLGTDPSLPAGRNPLFLRRRTSFLRRPDEGALMEALPERVLITGPMGIGKSRGVWESFAGRGGTLLWLTARPARQEGPSLAAQLAFALLTSPVYDLRAHTLNAFAGLGEAVLELAQVPTLVLERGGLAQKANQPLWMAELLATAPWPGQEARPRLVIDDLQALTPADRSWLIELLEELPEVVGPAVVLLGRSPVEQEEPWHRLAHRPYPTWTASELDALAEALMAGLSIPGPVRQLLVEEAGGRPFALEEGLFALTRGGLIRQVYGSFFFRGGEEVEAHLLSERLVQHAYAEADRLGLRRSLTALAAADLALPAGFLSGLAEMVGEPQSDGWPDRLARTGWLRPAPSVWGPGFDLAVPALRRALAATVPAASRPALMTQLGQLLPVSAGGAAWPRYRLLAGSPQGPAALLTAIEAEVVPLEKLAGALRSELAALREHGGVDPALELELLGHLLPLAHRQGNLSDYRADVERAQAMAAGDPRRYLLFSTLKASMAELEGRLPEAERILREALGREDLHEEQGNAFLVIRLGRILLRQEKAEEARQLLQNALPVFESEGKAELAASCLFYLGNVALHQGQFDRARELHQDALTRRRALGRSRSIGVSLSALGRVHLLLGHYPEALVSYREAEATFLGIGDEEEETYSLLGIGLALTRVGDYAGASAPLRRALQLRQKTANPVTTAIARLAVAENHLHQSRPDAALSEARRALFDLQMLPGRSAVVADAHQLVGRVLLALNRFGEASRAFSEATTEHSRQGVSEPALYDLAWWLEAALHEHDEVQARSLLEELERLLGDREEIGQREMLEFRLFLARWRLAAGPDDKRRFLRHLRRAYQELLRKANYLDPPKRHLFLFQVPDNRAILSAAAEHGLSLPDLPAPMAG